ncbi:VOC family protein [Brevibacillus centrosporus]|uniref:VOC family protein n=1 Tax=Brevibacillus centrosporus TaxID=54910 RepID=UPI003987D7EE
MTNAKITTFLMFAGQAEEAMNFYVSVFERAEIHMIHRFGSDAGAAEGSVMHATFSLKDQKFMCIDSIVKHEFGFTPAMSLFVECDTEKEIEHLYHKLSEGGAVLMPLSSTPISKSFWWISDRYGVSWQLNLRKE